MTKKYQICHNKIRSFFQAQNATKSVFGWGSAPDPAGEAYDAPPDPLVGWGPIPLPARRLDRRLRRLGSRAPITQNPGYASGATRQSLAIVCQLL